MLIFIYVFTTYMHMYICIFDTRQNGNKSADDEDLPGNKLHEKLCLYK